MLIYRGYEQLRPIYDDVPFPERIGDIVNHVKNCVHILR